MRKNRKFLHMRNLQVIENIVRRSNSILEYVKKFGKIPYSKEDIPIFVQKFTSIRIDARANERKFGVNTY